MATFYRVDRHTNLRQERSYPIYTRDNTSTWMACIVAITAIIGVFTYETGHWRTHSQIMPTTTSEVTAPSG